MHESTALQFTTDVDDKPKHMRTVAIVIVSVMVSLVLIVAVIVFLVLMRKRKPDKASSYSDIITKDLLGDVRPMFVSVPKPYACVPIGRCCASTHC